MATFQGTAQSFPGGVSDTFTTPFPIALGTKARDSFGNEFVFCQTGASTTVAPEMVVTIGANWSVAPITNVGGAGMLGVVADYQKHGNTSARVSAYPINTSVWVQIYGRTFVMYATPTGVASSGGALTTVRTSLQYIFKMATTDATTPAGQPIAVSGYGVETSLNDWIIEGMYVATDATPDASGASILQLDGTTALGVTLVSATHSGSTVAVWLNYPHGRHVTPRTSA